MMFPNQTGFLHPSSRKKNTDLAQINISITYPPIVSSIGLLWIFMELPQSFATQSLIIILKFRMKKRNIFGNFCTDRKLFI